MTEIIGAQGNTERVEAMLELDLIKAGRSDQFLSAEQRERRISELGRSLWPWGDHVRVAHERNPMNHVFDPKRKPPK